MLQQILDFISKPWLGSILGVLGLAVAIVFYLRSKGRTCLAFQHDEVSIVGGSSATFPAELEIRYSDKIVPRVTSDRIVLWNAGNTTIGGSQIVESDPLRMELPLDESILKATVIKVSREVNACRVIPVEQQMSRAEIKFDFLDPGDGLAFEILHTGAKSASELMGTLRGMPNGISDYGRVSWHSDRKFKSLPFPFSAVGRRFPFFLMLIFGIGMIIFGAFKPQFDSWSEARKPQTEEQKGPDSRWAIIIGGLLYAGMPGWILWMRRRRYPALLELDEEKSHQTKKNQEGEQDVTPNA